MNVDRVVGLDIGDKRIGVSIGDTEVKNAIPLAPLANDETIFRQIDNLLIQNDAKIVVIGLPRNAEGQETAQSVVVRNFATELSAKTDAKIVFQDESLTSVLAERRLRERKNFSESMLRDGTLDSEAAQLILADYLEGSRI